MIDPVASRRQDSDIDSARELFAQIIRPSMFWAPDRQAPSGWTEHVPFAFWLVDVMRPRTIVELGTQHGVSYSALCQAVKSLGLETACFAVDTWSGDQHAGFYDATVYRDFAAFHDQHYRAFSRMVRSSFDEALEHFENQTIDLLHIDGFHAYEAVRHDFESWLPRLSTNAVVLFHDTNVRERNFGVFRFWDEVSRDRPHFNFLHGHGLGVLAIGKEYAPALRLLLEPMKDHDLTAVRGVFAALGGALRFSFERAALERSLAERDTAIAALNEELKKERGQRHALERMLVERNEELFRAKPKAVPGPAGFAAGTRLNGAESTNPPRTTATRKASAAARLLHSSLAAPFQQQLRAWRAEWLVARSGLFDRDWYLKTYPDVAANGIDPIRHYLSFGANEGRHPSPAFSGVRYLQHYPDVAASGMNPLLHFIHYGRAEGRRASAVTAS